jgi:ubiquinone/menaquinone biosynthesis C-methylase UbiE
MRLIVFLLRPIYYLLYHQFSWTYDFVAAVVSLGRWQDWVNTALPYLNGQVLEIGFGPGHMQLSMNNNKILAYGLDESRQMAHQASCFLRKQGAISRLVCGYAQNIPFMDGAFNAVVSTFPSEYIFDTQTHEEIRRVLVPAGKLIIVPMAWITGMHPQERLVAWLMRISGETPGMPGLISAEIKKQFARTGFETRSEIVKLKGSQVLVIVAEKKPDS